MSIASRAQLLRELSTVVGHYISAENIDEVMANISERIGKFSIDLEETPTGADSETEDFLKAFLSAKEVEGRSAKTIARYDYICRKALNKMGVPLRDVSVFHLRKYLADEKARGLSDTVPWMSAAFCPPISTMFAFGSTLVDLGRAFAAITGAMASAYSTSRE